MIPIGSRWALMWKAPHRIELEVIELTADAVVVESVHRCGFDCLSYDDARKILTEVRSCAANWEPNARLLGNVRAGDIVEAVDALAQQAQPQDAHFNAIARRCTDRIIAIDYRHLGAKYEDGRYGFSDEWLDDTRRTLADADEALRAAQIEIDRIRAAQQAQPETCICGGYPNGKCCDHECPNHTGDTGLGRCPLCPAQPEKEIVE